MKKKRNIYDDFAKIKLCIESCNTLSQLESCNNMLSTFYSKYSSDKMLSTLYDILYITLRNKIRFNYGK